MSRSIFNKSDYEEIVKRINMLKPSSSAAWGKMNVSQMLAHCNLMHKQVLGLEPVGKLPNFFMRFIIRKIILGPKPYKPGLPTGKHMLITSEKDFNKEKELMLQYLQQIVNKGASADWPFHAAIGKLTGDEWGFAIWKHLDHHLRQFSV